jgi:3-phosphoshikimate 1-carboxyvinyltransferase
MMIAPHLWKGLALTLNGNVVSLPYIRMTAQMMRSFGAEMQWKNGVINVMPQIYSPCTYTIEADWSAASYWYEILSFCKQGSEIELTGLFRNSLQGDSKVVELFERLGVLTKYTENGVRLTTDYETYRTDGELFEYDFINEPDLAQTVVVTCALKNIPFRFTGLQSLRIKETDRMSALQKEMKKLGYIIRDAFDSELEWDGERCEPEADPVIDTYEDHRMAMAFAPVSVVLGKININDPLVVSKSYPGFWSDLNSVGFVLNDHD